MRIFIFLATLAPTWAFTTPGVRVGAPNFAPRRTSTAIRATEDFSTTRATEKWRLPAGGPENISVRIMAENERRIAAELAARGGSGGASSRDRPLQFDPLSSFPPVASYFFEQAWDARAARDDMPTRSVSGSLAPVAFFLLCVFAPWEYMRVFLAERSIVITLPWITAWQNLLDSMAAQ